MLQPLFPTRPWLWFGRLALLGLLLLTAAGGAGVGLLLALIDEAPPYEEFEDFSPALVSRVVDHTGEETVAQFYIERREFVSLDQIPWRLINAFLAIEDERFFHHVGVDPHGIAAAVFSSVVHGSRLRGASTLTMQLARKTLEEISDERLIERKIREALAALQIESRYTKEQILEFYLNQIPLGNGLYGVQAAARAYFGVGIDDLTIAQCATIAGIAKLPERFNPRDALANAARGRPFYYGRGPDDATARRNIVLGNMRDLGLISDEEYLLARSEPMRLGSPPDRGNRAPYFIDLVRRQILADPDLGYDTLFEGGVVIHSTVDLELQALAERTLSAGLVSAEALWQSRKIERLWDEEEPDNFGWRVDEGEQRLVRIAEVTETGLILELNGFVGDAPLPARLPHFDPSSIIQPGNLIEVVILETDGGQRTFRARVVDDSHVQGALVLIDVPTGEIRALVGGENWSDDHAAGQYNRAILGGRQPGSCFKPFVFAEALEQGMAPNRMFNDERVEFHTPGSEPYVPRNFENRHFGPTTLVEALEHSRNVVTVLLTQAVGRQNVIDFAQQFDFTVEGVSHWDIPPYVNLGLGIHDVTPLELACAFTPFINDGVIRRPIAWTRVVNRQGIPLAEQRVAERRVMSRQTARQVLALMEQVIRGGSGYLNVGEHLLGLEGMPAIAGKTGTTNSTVDAWFAGMTPDWVCVVFVGFDNNQSLGPRMTGSQVAGPIWREFIREALRLRPPSRMDFPEPPGLVRVDICSESGDLWTDACEEARRRSPEDVTRYSRVPFRDGTEPTVACRVHSRPSLSAPGRSTPSIGSQTLISPE